MKATELLKSQHRGVEKLFKQLEEAEDDLEKSRLFEELAVNLVAHDAIEREIFYPACEEKIGLSDLLGEALVEHGVVEFSLFCADNAQGEEDFDYKCTVLKDVIGHHVEEEEKELFPKVEKALGVETLEALGAEMQARFEEAKEEDFRSPLHDNLRQVLAGATKTTPASSAKKAAARKTAQRLRGSKGASLDGHAGARTSR